MLLLVLVNWFWFPLTTAVDKIGTVLLAMSVAAAAATGLVSLKLSPDGVSGCCISDLSCCLYRDKLKNKLRIVCRLPSVIAAQLIITTHLNSLKGFKSHAHCLVISNNYYANSFDCK